ncbi:L-serine ammonia-lyase, iron-sulfur-dependent, subunit alpha [Desulfocurvus sp. DL9XJH121]
MEPKTLLSTIRDELAETTGCTDPGGIALAAAAAAHALGGPVERIGVTLSPEVYKNAVSVGVPGTGRRGAVVAAALGALLCEHCGEGLAIMNHVSPGVVDAAAKMAESGSVRVGYDNACPDKLYIRADVQGGGSNALAVVQGDYDAVVRVARDGLVLPPPDDGQRAAVDLTTTFDLDEALDALELIPVRDLAFLLDAAEMNKAAADLDGLRFGASLAAMAEGLSGDRLCAALGKFYTGAAVEARMIGLVRPITAIAGSGNIGIITLLGIMGVAEALKTPREDVIRALAVSTVVTIAVKRILTRMTNVCGCTVAGASGVAAGTVFLLGGDRARMGSAVQAVIGAFGGVICDGAKESCAYKASATAGNAIEYGIMAVRDDVAIPPGMGIVGVSLERTVANLGRLNEQGMRAMGDCVLEIIKGNCNDVENKQ